MNDETFRIPRHALEKLFAAGQPLNDAGASPKLPELGKYHVVRELGRGGMGVVYEAEDRELGRRVAIKLLRTDALMDPGGRQRFQREAHMAAQLEHPNIAAIYEANDEYIVMQFVAGQTLAAWSTNDPALLVKLMRDVARALEHAHGQGIVHRDIKPQNLMIDTANERIFVMDFGLAKQTAVDSSISISGCILGTPSYMSPEQARGDRDVDARTDIYSLGATLYELFSGCRVFPDSGVYQVLKRVGEEDPPSLRSRRRDIDPDLETIVMKCLEKARERRYRDAGALAHDFSRWLEGKPISARPPSAIYRLQKFVRRHRTSVSLGALGLIAILALAILVPLWMHEAGRGAEAAKRAELWGRIAGVMADAELYRRGGEIGHSNALFEKGIAICREAITESDSAHAHYFLGRLNAAKGDHLAAWRALDAALERNPDLGEARYQRGLLFVEIYGSKVASHRTLFLADRRSERAPAILTGEIESIFPNMVFFRDVALADLSVDVGQSSYFRPVDGLYGRAELARLAGDHAEARRLTRRVIDAEPLYTKAMLSEVLMFLAEEKWEAAVRRASEAIDVHRGFGAAYVARSLAQFWQAERAAPDRRGELISRALADAERALELGDQTAQAYICRGNGHLEVGSLDAAIADYDAALTRDGRNAAALFNRAFARYRQARQFEEEGFRSRAREAWELCLADYGDSARVDPHLPLIHIHRGRARREWASWLEAGGEAGRAATMRQRALEDADRAVHLAPRSALAYYGRGVLRIDLVDAAGAREDLQRALELAEKESELHRAIRDRLAALDP